MNIGIELASEHAGRSTRNVTARNNLVYDSTAIGIAIGGYDRRRGSTEDCVIVNNTVVNTDGVELLVQFDTRNNVIANNVIVAGARHVFVENDYRENVGNVLDHNLYFSVDGSSTGTWQWKGVGYDDFDRWSARSGNDRHSTFADPGFVDAAAQDFSTPGGLARRRRRGVPGRRRARPTSQRRPTGAGRGDRPGRVRAGGAAALPHPFDRGAGHLRG